LSREDRALCNADIRLRPFHSLPSLVALRHRALLIASDFQALSGLELYQAGFATALILSSGSLGKKFINRNRRSDGGENTQGYKKSAFLQLWKAIQDQNQCRQQQHDGNYYGCYPDLIFFREHFTGSSMDVLL